MKHIIIISSSVREGRNSHSVALYFEKYLKEHQLATTKLIDLKALNFPIFEERLNFISSPTAKMLNFAKDIVAADGVIIATPEYNGGYPASLKNVIDLLHPEWKRKPIGIATVSSGPFGGTQVITSLQFSLWKIGALVVPAMFPVPTVEKTFDEKGNPSNKEFTDKNAAKFLDELLFWITAKEKMQK